MQQLGHIGEPYVTLKEFMRYAIVGGIAFLADFGTLVLAQETAMHAFAWGIYVSTVLGFLAGLTVNYVLSLKFVFIRTEDIGKGRTPGAFLAFGAIGLIGLAATELGMWFGVEMLAWNYRIVKFLVTGLVLAWNYLGRRIFVFGPEGGAQ